MKKLMGRKSVLMCLVGMMVILLGATAQAALIQGSISFAALYLQEPTITGIGATDLSNNSGFSWATSPNASITTASGNFLAYGSSSNVQFFTFSFSPLAGTAGTSGIKLWQLAGGQNFAMTSVSVFSRQVDAITLDGIGVFYFAGFDPTPGDFVFQANHSGSSYTFSSSANSIPEPGTLILLGSGLLGLALTGARKKFRK